MASLPIYQVTPGTYLVDDTGGQLAVPSLHRPSQASAATATAQIQSVSDLITQLQSSTNSNGQTYQPNGSGEKQIDTNGLWLEIVGYNPANTNLQLVLHNTSARLSYQINSATNLVSTNWDVGELLDGDPNSDETWLTPVPRSRPVTFYSAHQAPIIMQVWDVMDAVELNPTNSNGHIGLIGVQNGWDTPATNDNKVYYTIGGTAQNGIDYSNLPGVLTLAAGMRDTNIVINPTALGLQPDKTIVLTLLQNANCLIDPEYAFTTNILYGNPEVVPTARGDNERTCPNTPWSFTLGGHDDFGLPLTYLIATWPSHGMLDVSALPQVTYTPTNCFEGLDSFTFTVNNGFATSAPATVTLIVSDPVTANPAVAATIPGQPVAFALDGGDACGEGINYLLPANSPHGSLNTNALPYVSYTSTYTNFTGIDSFNYVVTSSCGGETATSSVTVFVAGGPNLAMGCNPFGTGSYIPLEWVLGTNETAMVQQQAAAFVDYKIYRSTVSGGPCICIGTNTDITLTTYMDTYVEAGQTNYYAVTFEFNYNSTIYETLFSDEVQAVVPSTYDLIAPDATWDVWDISTNHPEIWLHQLSAPFSSDYPNPYSANPALRPLPNTYWPPAVNGVPSLWSNNIALVLPSDWTNQTQLAQVKYTIAIDNDYWLYLNHSPNFIDSTNH
jgi:hypothetical protein